MKKQYDILHFNCCIFWKFYVKHIGEFVIGNALLGRGGRVF